MKNPVLNAIAERALKTFAQTLLASLGVSQANLFDVSTINALQLALSAAALSVLSSIVSVQIGKNGPSLSSEQVIPTSVAGH